MSRAINILTATEVKAAKPTDKVYRMSDGGGLVLIVKPAGGRYWQYRYKVDGKEVVASFGVYPDTSLADARRKAEQARKDMGKGDTPKDRARKDAQKQSEERRRWGHTFESVARAWYDDTCKLEGDNQPWTNAKHKWQVLASLEQFVFPKIGDIAIADLKAKDVRRVIDALKNKGLWETGQRVFQRISMVFDAGIEEEIIDTNPCDFLRRQKMFKNRPAPGHLAALKPEELPELIKAINAAGLRPMTEYALRLSLLTAVRPGELRHAEWSEFNIEEKTWLIPGDKMKMRRDHLVPLSDEAIEVLYQLEPLSGKNRYLFPHRSKGDTPMSDGTCNMALKRMKFGGRTTAHGFRSLFSTWGNEAGIYRKEVIEMQLSHLEGSSVHRAYNRSEYLEERKTLMQDWANFITEAGIDNVTSIQKGKRA